MKDRSPKGPHEVVDHAITSRQSVRAFLPTPVSRATLEEILAIATRAPSSHPSGGMLGRNAFAMPSFTAVPANGCASTLLNSPPTRGFDDQWNARITVGVQNVTARNQFMAAVPAYIVKSTYLAAFRTLQEKGPRAEFQGHIIANIRKVRGTGYIDPFAVKDPLQFRLENFVAGVETRW